jgi:hypothetical protein
VYAGFILDNIVEGQVFMRTKLEITSYARKLHRLYAGGLILVSFIILQDFLDLGTSDPAVLISELAFSVALPLLSATLVLDVVEQRYPYGPRHAVVTWIVHAAFVVGILAALTGVGAAFWHPARITGVTFLCSLFVTFIIYGIYVLNLDDKAGKP